MNLSRTITLTGILGMLVFTPFPVTAAESIATLVASRGTVTVEAGGQERILEQGKGIYAEDQVTTGEKSFAVLQFVDGAKVTVRPESVLLVKEYAFNGGDQDAATLSLVRGGLRVITGAMAKSNPEKYKVETPTALMGVRGTEFALMICDDEACEEPVEISSDEPVE